MVFRKLFSKWEFRHIAGAICFVAGVIFITIDASLLYDGATRKAVTATEKLRFGIVAATIPIILSIMPFLFALTWVPGRRIGRPSGWTVVLLVMWCVFCTYNIYGAGGSVSHIRTDALSQRTFASKQSTNLESRRKSLQDQLAAIPSNVRAPAAVEGAMAVERAKVGWVYTHECKSTDNARERKFCAGYASLTTELGTAKHRDKLETEIKSLDEVTVVAGWVATDVNPDARFWAWMLGLSDITVQNIDPLWTPVLLQIGSWYFLAFGLVLFGFHGHRGPMFGQRLPTPHKVAALADTAAGGPNTHRSTPAANLKYEPPQLARWFFAEHTRPGVSGGIEESIWYAQYSNVCAHYGTIALPLEQFRSIARKCGAMIIEVDGVVTYKGVMPAQPRSAA